jgi:hypothetical protein
LSPIPPLARIKIPFPSRTGPRHRDGSRDRNAGKFKSLHLFRDALLSSEDFRSDHDSAVVRRLFISVQTRSMDIFRRQGCSVYQALGATPKTIARYRLIDETCGVGFRSSG